MNLEDLEIKLVIDIDNKIEELKNRRHFAINIKTDEHKAYYEIKDYIEKQGYRFNDLSEVIRAYKYYAKGESYSCSVDEVIRWCKSSVKLLFDAGYGN